MNILNITFDYCDVKKWKNKIIISRKWKTLRGTWSVETEDDVFFINNNLCSTITVIAWSRYSNKNQYFDDKWYYIIRDKFNTDKTYYNKFIKAKSYLDAEKTLIEYNNYITKKTLNVINNINSRREKKGYLPIKFDLILTPTSRFTIISALKLKRLLWIPLISTLHVNEEELQNIDSFKLPWSDIILKYDHITKSESDYVIAKNSNIYKIIKPINKNVLEVYNDITVNKRFIHNTERKNSVLYVWRLSFEKGIDRLYKIANGLSKLNINIHICGKTLDLDPIVNDIFSKITNLPNVVYHWHVDKKSLYKIMNQSKIIILPSRTEVFNQAILEGGYYWCIPISTNVWSATTCIFTNKNIIDWENDTKIISRFLERIILELKDYNENTWIIMHKKYSKYAQNINKKKKFIFFKKVLHEQKTIQIK